jgi:hypothetical protein
MSRFTKSIKIFLALVFTFSSLVNTSFFTIQSAKADGCSLDPTTYKLVVYSDSLIDPQYIAVGAVSGKYWVQIQSSANIPTASDCTTYVQLSFNQQTTNEVGVSGELGDNKVTISKGNTRASFYISGSESGNATITASTTTGTNIPSQQLQNGMQTAVIGSPAPNKNLLLFTNNIHGVADTISGKVGAVTAAISTPGVKVRAYTDVAGTIQLGSDATVAADGSFPPIAMGDDQYRNVTLRAVYPGTPEVLSSIVLVGDPIIIYPSLVTGLSVQHSMNGLPYLSWEDGGVGVSYVIYRKAYSDLTPFNDSNIIATTIYKGFEDGDANFGDAYLYLVKQVISGSYTPEYLPTIKSKIDVVLALDINPEFISIKESRPAPYVTAYISDYIRNAQESWDANPNNINISLAPLTIVFTRHDDGKKYFAGYRYSEKADIIIETDPYKIVDTSNNSIDRLPDGIYTIEVVALDAATDIDDRAVASTRFTIDTVAPNAPVIGRLRYTNNVLSGVAGAAEPGTYLYAYDSNGAKLNTHTVIIEADGSFDAGIYSTPSDGMFYLSLHDNVDNVSPTTQFDVLSIPNSPLVDKVTMQQNKPGTNDVILGTAGAVDGGVMVEIFNVDPLLNQASLPYRSLIANSDGSFTQEVGDNAYASYWVVVRSGSGLLSNAVKLTNAISINAVSVFNATVGDGVVKLNWTSVPNTSYYIIDIYDETDAKHISTVTIMAGQTTLQLSLQNAHKYRFSIVAFDVYGNSSTVNVVYGTPVAPMITLASSITSKKVISNAPASSAPKISSDENLTIPAPTSSPSTPTEDNNRNWAPWILTIGILILLIAGGVAYLLWGKQTEVATSVAKVKPTLSKPVVESGTVEEITENTSKPIVAKSRSKDELKKPKPRW